MSRRPTDQELDRLLQDLPRETASPGFSSRVLEGLDAPPRARPGGWLLAAATLAAAVAVGLWLLPRVAPPELSATETRALEREHRLLVQELEELKASLRDSQPAPVLYLGGTESVDLVLDLEPVWRAGPAGSIRPAAYGGDERAAAAAGRHGGE